MNTKSTFVAMAAAVVIAQLVGCAGPGYYYGGVSGDPRAYDYYGHRDRSGHYEPTPPNPHTFYSRAEDIGKDTTAFDPCVSGSKKADSRYSATSDMSDETRRGRNDNLRANVRKSGECN